jgi:hypothetical protein
MPRGVSGLDLQKSTTWTLPGHSVLDDGRDTTDLRQPRWLQSPSPATARCSVQLGAIRNAQYRLDVNGVGALHRPKRAENDQQPCEDLLQTVEHGSV